jgi:hypothetical protein
MRGDRLAAGPGTLDANHAGHHETLSAQVGSRASERRGTTHVLIVGPGSAAGRSAGCADPWFPVVVSNTGQIIPEIATHSVDDRVGHDELGQESPRRGC